MTIKETCVLGNHELQYEQVAMHLNEPDVHIHEHLATLYFITKAFDCMDILEIGTGNGASALAFVEAGASVVSLDIENKDGIRKYFKQIAPYRVTIRQENSQAFIPANWYDLIFIDGDHDYIAVKKDLEKYATHARKFLILHDITNPAHTGVGKAVKEFLINNPIWDYYQWFNCNGLAVLHRRKK